MSVVAPNVINLRSVELARRAAQRRSALDLRPQQSEAVVVDQPVVATAKKRRMVHPASIGIMIGIMAISWLAFHPFWDGRVHQTIQAAAPAVTTAGSRPATKGAPAAVVAKPTDRVLIPSLGVNAPLVSVGLVYGALGTPNSMWQVGEYSGGVQPGLPGVSILVGHSGAPGQWGVFEHLSSLAVGQTVIYQTAAGQKTTFTVTSSAAYPVNQVGSHALFDPASGSVLRLVSCYGNWNPTTKEYDQRWIVSAAKN